MQPSPPKPEHIPASKFYPYYPKLHACYHIWTFQVCKFNACFHNLLSHNSLNDPHKQHWMDSRNVCVLGFSGRVPLYRS